MTPRDEELERLRAAIEGLAGDDAAVLLAEARAEARGRVRAILADALARSMLDHVHEQLEPPASERRIKPRRTTSEATTRPPVDARRAPAPEAAPDKRTGELGWYIYGVIAGEELEPTAEPAAIDPSYPVCMLRQGPLAAVASRVDLDEFGESQLRAHLADMDWVERTARSHEQVLANIRSRTTVIPMRMCTVYRDEDGVREMLGRESESFQAALAGLRGKTEWGVKVFAHSVRAHPVDAPRDDAAGASGTAYMGHRRREREAKERAAEQIDDAAGLIHDRLSEIAADGITLTPHRPEAGDHEGEMILNGAYLVEDLVQESFHAEVRALQEELGSLGLELEATGPWPAYNFIPGTIGPGW